MIEFIVIVLGLALFLYALLAGADFGAGVLEIFPVGLPRERRAHSVGKAMGPVWEANHIWLILALVITFNAFPKIFWFFAEYFHFPLGALVIGIICRGSAFTFLHYDPIQDRSEKFYHWIFGLSSIWCTMWIGIIMGSLLYGNFSLSDTDMWSRYFGHWLSPLPFLMGIFVSLLMTFNAGLFLALEEKDDREAWIRVTLRIFLLLIVTGVIFHLTFFALNPERWAFFFLNPVAIIFIAMSGLLLYPQVATIRSGSKNRSRILAGAQLAFVFAAAFAPLYPRVVLFRDFTAIDFYAAAAPEPVLRYLVIALVVGCLFILPAYFYLMKIFKYRHDY